MEYKDSLINFDLKSFLEKFSEKDIFTLKDRYPENYILLSEQLKIYPKARIKLPEFCKNYCFFTTKSYEQSSSETLAKYKAGLFTANTVIDLTGGLGVDDWGFSKKFVKVISVDNDAKLNKLARMNFRKLGVNNIERIDSDAGEFIKQSINADLVYIDADRRSKSKKAVTLTDSSPPVLEILPRLTEISGKILLKLSPLVDITYLLKSLPHIAKIHVISLENDVKEILTYIDTAYKGTVSVEAIDISKSDIRKYSADYKLKNKPKISSAGAYFYEPANSLIKSGLVNNYAYDEKINIISENGVYLLADKIVNDFFGRSFKVISTVEFSKSKFKNYLKEHKITQANLSERNFPISPPELMKLFKLKDGGEDYFFFTRNNIKKKIVYHCKKIEA